MNNFEEVKSRILAGEYKSFKHKPRWGGADAAVTNNHNDKWLSDPSIIVVCTKNAVELIWLIETLRPIAHIDYLSKFAFYPAIVKAASDFIIENGEEDVEGLLLCALEAVKEFL